MNMMTNAVRRVETMFPGFFTGSTKHDHYKDFGYPDHISFDNVFKMYNRNGFAKAGVEKTILKTWEEHPEVWENTEQAESRLESDIRQRFEDISLWQCVAEADRRSLVGGYSAVILRYADGKRFQEPVDQVPGGLDGIVELIPAWAAQIIVSDWDTDETSPNYGQPSMFEFNEAAIGERRSHVRSFSVHPDRVLVWSQDGTIHNRSFLEPGFNDLLDMEKVSGAGGEGFWKNAKSAPVLEIDKEARVADMAAAMGVQPSAIADKMEEQVADWQAGFDSLLMLQGMQAKSLSVTLPIPEHFFNIALQGFAASVNIPQKILVGNQTGERASVEDAKEWARVNMARRSTTCLPAIRRLVNRFEAHGLIPERDWHVEWADLTESSMEEKIERALKMAEINAKMGDEPVYLPEEIRTVTDHDTMEAGHSGGGDDNEI